MPSRTLGIVAGFGSHLSAVSVSGLSALLASLCVAASATAAVGSATGTSAAAGSGAAATMATAVTAVAPTSTGSLTTSAAPPSAAPTTVTTPTTVTPVPSPATTGSPTTPTTTAGAPTPGATPAAPNPPPTSAPVTSTPTPTPVAAPVAQPCSAGSAGGATAGTAASGAAGASAPAAATSASGTVGGTPSCAPETAAAPATGAMTTGAVVTGADAGHSEPDSSQPAQTPSMGGGSAAAAAKPAAPTTRSVPTHPTRTRTPSATHSRGSGVRLLTRFAARNAGGARARRSESQPRAVQQAGNVFAGVRFAQRPRAANAAARNPLMPVGNASSTGTPPTSSARAWILRESLAAPSSERTRGRGTRRSQDGRSPAADAPPPADLSSTGHGGRPTRGVGVAVPGGTSAPSSLMVRLGFAQVAASWLAGVTGEAIHLQFPVTHRLERPG